MRTVKTAGGWTAGLALMVLLAILLGTIVGCAGIRQVPSSTPGVTVFETGSGSFFGPIMGLVFVVIGALSLVLLIGFLRPFLRAFDDLGLWSVALIPLIPGFFLGLGSWLVYSEPLQSQIIVDKNAQVITVERDYLVRDETTRVAFDEVDHVKYQYGTRAVQRSDGGMTFTRYGTVKLVRRNGTEIKLYGDGQGSTRDLAEGIARATGWRLESEKRNR